MMQVATEKYPVEYIRHLQWCEEMLANYVDAVDEVVRHWEAHDDESMKKLSQAIWQLTETADKFHDDCEKEAWKG